MNFNKHLEIKGGHAVFGASQHSWLRYDDDKLIERVDNLMSKNLGTEMHEFARSQIDLGIRSTSVKGLRNSLNTYIYRKYFDEELDCLSSYGKKMINGVSRLNKAVMNNLQTYINDCVGYCMTTEQRLCADPYYFYGTADAISFRDHILRIFDLKTGRIMAHMDQIMVYAAYFCLEYAIDPKEIELFDLRLYQNEQVVCHNPTAADIEQIVNKVIHSRDVIQKVFYESV